MNHGVSSRAGGEVKELPPASRIAILVLGMHRSGTSALTRVVSLLGADLPATLMPAARDNNEAGFWESLDAYRLNDAVLSAGGSSWDDLRKFDLDQLPSGARVGLKARALSLVEREFPKSNLFVLKDPRLCRLMPFWLPVLQELGAEPVCILPVRNPMEVAASLGRRDGFSPEKAYLLWLRHVLDAEQSTRRLRRAFSSYDGLLGDWRGTAKALSEELDISWPAPLESAATAIAEFLQPRHRHHIAEGMRLRDHPGVPAWVDDTYAALLGLLREPNSQHLLASLDVVCGELDRASEVFSSLRRTEAANAAEIARVQAEALVGRQHSELESLKQQKAAIQTQLREVGLRLHGIQTSSSWQLARPLCAVELQWPGVVRGVAAMAKIGWWAITLRLSQRLRLRRQVQRLLASGLFDLPWFIEKNADIVLRGADPVIYWLTQGWREGRDANAVFDGAWYSEQNPEVTNTNPLEHYLNHGANEGRAPNPLFHVAWYLEDNPDVSTSGLTPLAHYLRHGAEAGRDPHPLFETGLYLEGQGGNIPAKEALRHFTRGGKDFDVGAYRDPESLLFLQQSYLARTAMRRVWDRRRGDQQFAVYLQCGSGSIHQRWLTSASKPWDLIVNHYDWTYAGQIASDLELQQVGELPGTKFTSFHTLLQTCPELISEYAYILLLDDDIYLEERNITALFAAAQENELDLAQASLSLESQGCHDVFFFRGTGGLRYTNGVEIMMPVISRRALQNGSKLFGETISGWGLDLALGKVVSERLKGRAAICDQIVAQHTKPIDLSVGDYYRMLKREHIFPLIEYRYLQMKYRTDRAFFEV